MKNNINKDINNDFCPICDKEWISQCKCPLSEKTCSNNHTWYVCPIHNKINIGIPNHSFDISICQCNKLKEK